MAASSTLVALLLAVKATTAYRQHPKGGAACQTDWDCTLGGGCEGNVCVCDAAFTGANCTYFDVLPTLAPVLNQTNASTWGGRANYDPTDNRWHLHVSEMGNGCGLDDWEPGSTIVHFTSPALWGPYTRQGLATPAFSHNAEARRMPDGSWILIKVGAGSPLPKYNNTVYDCRSSGNGTTPRNAPRVPSEPLPGYVPWGIHRAASPYGPWVPTNLSNLWPESVGGVGGGCLAPLRNGSWVATQGGGGMGAMEIANAWDGNWTHLPRTAMAASLKRDWTGDEDPDVFQTARGYFHLVVHSWGWPCNESATHTWWTDGNTNPGGCGAHWYSADGRNWMWAATVLYNNTVVYVDGSWRGYGRERPKIIMDATNTFPVALMNGVAQAACTPKWCGNEGPPGDDHSFTMIVPLATPTPGPARQPSTHMT